MKDRRFVLGLVIALLCGVCAAQSPVQGDGTDNGSRVVGVGPARYPTSSQFRNAYTVGGSSSVNLGSPVTLFTSPTTGLYFVLWRVNETAGGNCTTAGSVQIDVAYKNADTTLTTSVAGSGFIIQFVNDTANAAASTLALSTTSASRNVAWFATTPLYAGSGTNIVYQPWQTVSATGGTCSAFATFEVTAQVLGPY